MQFVGLNDEGKWGLWDLPEPTEPEPQPMPTGIVIPPGLVEAGIFKNVSGNFVWLTEWDDPVGPDGRLIVNAAFVGNLAIINLKAQVLNWEAMSDRGWYFKPLAEWLVPAKYALPGNGAGRLDHNYDDRGVPCTGRWCHERWDDPSTPWVVRIDYPGQTNKANRIDKNWPIKFETGTWAEVTIPYECRRVE